VPRSEIPPPKVPVDYQWAQELGLIRKSANFVSTITDERGGELVYAGKSREWPTPCRLHTNWRSKHPHYNETLTNTL
jgi:hypothetical protein